MSLTAKKVAYIRTANWVGEHNIEMTQSTITCSKWTIETLEQGVKYV